MDQRQQDQQPDDQGAVELVMADVLHAVAVLALIKPRFSISQQAFGDNGTSSGCRVWRQENW
jgi:hypothetical protein